MKQKVTSILVVANEMKLINRIVRQIRVTLPQPLQFQKETKFKTARDIIMRGLADILVIGTELPEGDGEELVKLANQRYPEHPIIVFSDKDDDYRLSLYDKHDILKCITTNKLLSEFEIPLLRAKQKADKFIRRRIVFPNLVFNADETCYIKADDNYIEAMIYDVDQKKFHHTDKKMTMKRFMEEYNTEGDFIRCHASYIVNKRMIQRVDTSGNYLVLVIKEENHDEIQIPISRTYRDDVKKELEGLY